MKGRIFTIAIAVQVLIAFSGSAKNDREVTDRFGANCVSVVSESIKMEAFKLDGSRLGYESSANSDPSKKSWFDKFRVVSEGVLLSVAQMNRVQVMLLDGTSYWDPRKDDTLQCLFVATYALRMTSPEGTVVAVFENECYRVRIIEESGAWLGGAMIEGNQMVGWNKLFSELWP